MSRWVVTTLVLACVGCTGASDEVQLPQVRRGEHALDFADAQGEVADVLAAHAFLLDTSSLEGLYAAAQQRDPRSTIVWAGLESYVRELGAGIAEEATQPRCFVLPSLCAVKWDAFAALSRSEAGGVRMRQLLATSFDARARQRGLEARLVLSLVNTLVAGMAVRGTLKAAALEAVDAVAPVGIGKSIAEGHAFEKHVVGGNEFGELGIKTTSDFARHIEDVVAHAKGANVRQLSGGRVAYWSDATGTVVIWNPKAPDGGTAFRPTLGKTYFTDVLQ